MNDVNDSAGACRFQVLEEGTSVPSICFWRVDALCGKIIKFLEICVPERLISMFAWESIGSELTLQSLFHMRI